jgi:hypothetical protein
MTLQASPSLLGVELSFRGAPHLFIASNTIIRLDMGFAAWRDNQPHCHMISANGGGISEVNPGTCYKEQSGRPGNGYNTRLTITPQAPAR